MVLLLAVTAGAVYMGLQFRSRYIQRRTEAEGIVAAAQAELEAAQAQYAAVDPNDPANARRLTDIREEVLSEARQEEQRLRDELAELDASLKEMEAKLAELENDEEYAFYKAIYDSYAEGKAYVEELLADH